MANIEYSRIIIKRSTIALEVPTVPAIDDLNTFIPTDIFEGELFYNVPDEKLYTRTGASIVQLTGLGCCNLEDTLSSGNTTSGNDIVITSGDEIKSTSGKSIIGLNPITAVITSFDAVAGDASITLDHDNGLTSYYINGTSGNTSQCILGDGTLTSRVIDNTFSFITGLTSDISSTESILFATDSATVNGASYVKVTPSSIILTKDSTIATNVMQIELTNTRINFKGAATNLININPNILPAYDDDTAAGVGGLVTGDMYQTTGGGAAPLNVAGIVMTKQ